MRILRGIRMMMVRLITRATCHCEMRATCFPEGGVPTAWVRFVSSPCALFSPVLGIHPWCALDFSHPPGNDEEAAIIYTEVIFDIDEGVAAYRR